MTSTAKADFEVYGGGSVYMLRPLNKTAQLFLEDHVSAEESSWLGASLAVEHRYICDVVSSLRQEGFVVR